MQTVSLVFARRYQALSQQFEQLFGTKPACFVRVPGRVNLIGEVCLCVVFFVCFVRVCVLRSAFCLLLVQHIDYSLFSVLPMALELDVVIAASTSTSPTPALVLHNTDSARYKPVTVPLSASAGVAIDRSVLLWSNYVLCGYKGRHMRQPHSLLLWC